jgi:hypothetical protein
MEGKTGKKRKRNSLGDRGKRMVNSNAKEIRVVYK